MDHENSKEPMGRFFDLSPDLCCAVGKDGRIRIVNDAFDALGYTREELSARRFVDLIHHDDKAVCTRALAKAVPGIPSVRFESCIRRCDGSYRRVDWTSAASGSSSETQLLIGRDVTDVKAVGQNERKQLHAELERQKHQYQAIFDTLPQMIWLKGQD